MVVHIGEFVDILLWDWIVVEVWNILCDIVNFGSGEFWQFTVVILFWGCCEYKGLMASRPRRNVETPAHKNQASSSRQREPTPIPSPPSSPEEIEFD